IGSGIFLVPAAVLQQTKGSVGFAFLVWLVGGLLSLLGALCYGELSARNPQAGGLYIYIRDSFGKLSAFLYGWALFFVIANAGVATLAVAFPAYLSEIVPLDPVLRKVISVLMIAVVTFVNVRGTRQSADLQNWTTFIKGGAIIIMATLCLIVGQQFSAFHSIWPAQLDSSLFQGFGVA